MAKNQPKKSTKPTGPKLEIRESKEGYISASAWFEGTLVFEIGRISTRVAGPSNGKVFIAWRDMMQSLFQLDVQRAIDQTSPGTKLDFERKEFQDPKNN